MALSHMVRQSFPRNVLALPRFDEFAAQSFVAVLRVLISADLQARKPIMDLSQSGPNPFRIVALN